MKYEVEMKFRVNDFMPILGEAMNLFNRQVFPGAALVHEDVYYSHPSRNFKETDETLRIRTQYVKMDDKLSQEQSWLTYKGPKVDKQTKTRLEEEFEFFWADKHKPNLINILNALGFKESGRVKKQRQMWGFQLVNDNLKNEAARNFSCHLACDEVENLGKYIELEIVALEEEMELARKAIIWVSERIGLFNIERKSYIELLEEPTLEKKFKQLMDQWTKETSYLSSSTKIAAHPAYLEIVGMGTAAIPLIFKDWKQSEDRHTKHWFSALRAITGANPIKENIRGYITKMRDAWLEWGKENGY